MLEKLKRSLKAGITASDARGQMGIRNAIMLPIALGVGALVAAFVVPVGLNELVNVSTTSYSSGAASLWNNLDLFVTLAVLGLFIGYMLDVF